DVDASSSGGMAAVVLTDGSAIRKSASMGTSPSSSRGPPATARPQLLGPTSPTAVKSRGRVRAASASAGTRRTRSASAAAAVASTSRRAPAPPAITLPPASAS
ncbi:hypothetical protein ACJX0J_028639, partial [Zea mays]